MNELNNKDEWAEIEAMFPVDTDDEQLNFANANKIIGLREARTQIEQYVTEQVRLGRIDEHEKSLADFHPYYLILMGKEKRLTEVGEMHLKALQDRLDFHNSCIAELKSKEGKL